MSPDDKYLYIVLSNKPGVERAEITSDGKLGKPEHVVTLPRHVPDGVAFDVEGNLYITCYSPDVIWRLTPAASWGAAEDWASVTLSAPTNIAFGGADMKTLLVASLGRWHLTRAQMPIAGHRVHYPKLT